MVADTSVALFLLNCTWLDIFKTASWSQLNMSGQLQMVHQLRKAG